MAAGGASSGALAALSAELAEAVERAAQWVVAVHGRRRLPASGVIWPTAAIVTADHVLEREEDITITLPSGQQLEATVVGRDPGSDLAVLRASGNLPSSAVLAPQGEAKAGHLVLALARLDEGPLASFGVISSVGGPWRTARGGILHGYIRADLTLYPGFSGGPLVDAQGRVAGLNSSRLARGQSVALPADLVDGLVRALVAQGRVRKPYLGVGSQVVRLPEPLQQRLGLSQATALMAVWVEPGSPAEQAGLLMGDLLVAAGNQLLRTAEDLQMVLGASSIGQPLAFLIVRGGQRQVVSITPGERG